MVLCAVAKPRWNDATNTWWDGKVGCWPLTTKVPAARASKNREKGTLETKSVTVTRTVYKTLLLDAVFPAIKAAWPPGAPKDICIQQDNARPHVSVDDPDVLRASQCDGFNIRLVFQPANSPDCNILDLGFFRALQSAQIFRTLQYVLIEILKNNGGNNFRMPHPRKDQLARQGRLEEEPSVDPEVISVALALLCDEDEAAHVAKLEKDQVQLAQDVALCTAFEAMEIGGALEATLCDEVESMNDRVDYNF